MDRLDSLDLAKTLDCGQAFRFNLASNGSWSGVAGSRALTISETTKTQILSDSFWFHYFDMDFDYESACKELSGLSPLMQRVVTYSQGIHILNQDPFETLISFIISQNNNIKRIKKIVNSLCQNLTEDNSFPSPSVLASCDLQTLRSFGLGFRDKYVLDAATKVASGLIDLPSLFDASFTEACDCLKQIKGVGDKVANCILLFAYHRFESFPMDVWMKRVMAQCFDNKKGTDLFGPLAGFAQQLLFFYARNNELVSPQ